MRGGHLRHRITIQRKTESRDSHGGVTYTWADWYSCWAEIVPLSGQELWQARQAGLVADERVSMRYCAGLTTKDRIVFGSRVLNIEYVQNVEERDIEAVALCIEKE